jgi:alkyl sulfatase BDS1-like metallo-beta-lactamase superfamily hydrolase
VEGHSKSIADLYTGWFNGEVEDLLPVSKVELAANMVRDFGRTKLLRLARKAYNDKDYRWTLTLATYVWRAENKPKNDALYWRTQAIKRLAENLTAAQWRNYLFTTAMIDWGMVPTPYFGATVIASRPYYMALRSVTDCFELMAMHLDPVKAADVDLTIDLYLTNDPDLQTDQVH